MRNAETAYDDESQGVFADYELPELPEPADYPGYGDDARVELVLFRFKQENIVLGEGYAVADAQEYCNRDDTHGDGWFVGYRR